ncbi:hypothetical protein JYU34_017534 [Plutella xylostella]|uniref:Uncharacterized protein n=1 Tax=Plutella xylostella TaxID=51655 RepID=A0ABQ7Q285_PLUXY|nr:hypothetical protein JYU34_017534 [Plutella xylostella]
MCNYFFQTEDCRRGEWQDHNKLKVEVQHPKPIIPRPTLSSRSAHPHSTSQHRSSRRYQVDVEVDRLMAIEEKQGEAELLTAWANALKPKGDKVGAAHDGVNILIEIAQQLSRNTKLRASRPITIVTSYGSRCCCAVVDDVMI